MSKVIKSQSVAIAREAELVFDFISDFTHFTHLLPPEAHNAEFTAGSCRFDVNGLSLGLTISEKKRPVHLAIQAEGKLPFQVSFAFDIAPSGDSACQAVMSAITDMNMFMAMMAEKPLANLMDMIVSRLKEEMEKGASA